MTAYIDHFKDDYFLSQILQKWFTLQTSPKRIVNIDKLGYLFTPDGEALNISVLAFLRRINAVDNVYTSTNRELFNLETLLKNDWAGKNAFYLPHPINSKQLLAITFLSDEGEAV